MRVPKRRFAQIAITVLSSYVLLTLAAGWLMPVLLFHPPVPNRSSIAVEAGLVELCPPRANWSHHGVAGPGAPLRLHWLHRPGARGVAVQLHGFGDDALGSAPRLLDLPDMDAVCFTFRGRDLVPEALITLGGLERAEVVRVVAFLESNGWARDRQVLVGTSQGAGVAILALADLEKNGKPLGGALLESPFLDLRSAAKHHLRGSLGWIEPLARPAERLGIWRAGRIAGFKADDVSPSRAIRELRTPLAIISGTGDWITPIEDVRTLAGPNGDLTVIPGAGHLEASQQVAGGWTAWAKPRLDAWGFVRP